MRHLLLLAACAAAFCLPAAASATAPGANGAISYRVVAADQQLWSVGPDGGDRRQLLGGGLVASAAWAPDGERIAYVDDGDVRVGATRVTSGATTYDAWPAWSPDGRRLAFARTGSALADRGIYTVAATGGTAAQLTNADDTSPDWSPNGDTIVFQRSTGGTRQGLWLIDPTGSESSARQVVPGSTAYYDWKPAFTADGAWIVFARQSTTTAESWLMKVRPDGSGLTEVLHSTASGSGIRDVTPSPDGRRIAYSQRAAGAVRVHVIDATTAAEVASFAGPTNADDRLSWQATEEEQQQQETPPAGGGGGAAPVVDPPASTDDQTPIPSPAPDPQPTQQTPPPAKQAGQKKPYCAKPKKPKKKGKKPRKLPKVCADIADDSAPGLFWQDTAWRLGEVEINGVTTYRWSADDQWLEMTGNEQYVGAAGSAGYFKPVWKTPPLTGDDWEDAKRPKDLPRSISIAVVPNGIGETESKATYHHGAYRDYDCGMKTDETTRAQSIAVGMTETRDNMLVFELNLGPAGWKCPAEAEINYASQKWPAEITSISAQIPVNRLIDVQVDDIREITIPVKAEYTWHYGDATITQWWAGEITLERPRAIVDVKKPPRDPKDCRSKHCPF